MQVKNLTALIAFFGLAAASPVSLVTFEAFYID
jgi:hypothetical protein